MVQALIEIEQCITAPHFVPNRATAVALLNRGFIQTAVPCGELDARTLYILTVKGSTALRIERRQRERDNGADSRKRA